VKSASGRRWAESYPQISPQAAVQAISEGACRPGLIWDPGSMMNPRATLLRIRFPKLRRL
jgi:hypothetical protein